MQIHDTADTAASQWRIPNDVRLTLLAFLSADPAQPATMTYDEFLQWADEDTLAEWADGRVVMTSPASKRHQDLVRFLNELLFAYATTHDLGIVLQAPFQMKLPASGREPDVLFVGHEHRDRVHATRLEGAADLVIEVISPESRGRDRGTKFYEYEAGGVAEYWLIDPDDRRAEFYQLDASGKYQIVLPDADGVYRARVPTGFWLRVDWLWREPLPSINRIMLDIDGAAYAQRMMDELTDSGYAP